MSTCISSHGEFGSHTPDGRFGCTRCGVFDEAGVLAEVDRLRLERDDAQHEVFVLKNSESLKLAQMEADLDRVTAERDEALEFGRRTNVQMAKDLNDLNEARSMLANADARVTEMQEKLRQADGTLADTKRGARLNEYALAGKLLGVRKLLGRLNDKEDALYGAGTVELAEAILSMLGQPSSPETVVSQGDWQKLRAERDLIEQQRDRATAELASIEVATSAALEDIHRPETVLASVEKLIRQRDGLGRRCAKRFEEAEQLRAELAKARDKRAKDEAWINDLHQLIGKARDAIGDRNFRLRRLHLHLIEQNRSSGLIMPLLMLLDEMGGTEHDEIECACELTKADAPVVLAELDAAQDRLDGDVNDQIMNAWRITRHLVEDVRIVHTELGRDLDNPAEAMPQHEMLTAIRFALGNSLRRVEKAMDDNPTPTNSQQWDYDHTWHGALTGGPCPSCGETTLIRSTGIHGPNGIRTLHHTNGQVCDIPMAAGHLKTLGSEWRFVTDAEFGWGAVADLAGLESTPTDAGLAAAGRCRAERDELDACRNWICEPANDLRAKLKAVSLEWSRFQTVVLAAEAWRKLLPVPLPPDSMVSHYYAEERALIAAVDALAKAGSTSGAVCGRCRGAGSVPTLILGGLCNGDITTDPCPDCRSAAGLESTPDGGERGHPLGWLPAKPGDTPGQLLPGEGDSPLPVEADGPEQPRGAQYCVFVDRTSVGGTLDETRVRDTLEEAESDLAVLQRVEFCPLIMFWRPPGQMSWEPMPEADGPEQTEPGEAVTYLVVAPQIVGSAENWATDYYAPISAQFTDRAVALKSGERHLGHDDFCIVTLRGGKLWAYGPEMRDFAPDERDRLTEIGRHLAIEVHPDAHDEVDSCEHCGLTDRHDLNCAVFFIAPEIGTEAVHGWFGLSYANYLTLPRSLMQSMPDPWQNAMVDLLRGLHEAYAHLEWPDYKVEAGKWCYLSDLDEHTLDALVITSECAGLPVGERKHDLSECFPGQCTYYDRDGEEIDHQVANVFVPCADPMPHYNRGRTHVPRADEIAASASPVPAAGASEPGEPCAYCVAFTVGSPATEHLVCECTKECGAVRCNANAGRAAAGEVGQ